MRGLLRFVGLLIVAAIIAALAIFAAQNITRVPVQFVYARFTGNLWWICVGSAVLGFVLAFLLLAPGRVAAGWRGRSLRREQTRLQDQLAVQQAREEQMRAEHAHLRAEHRQVAAERDHLRATATQASAPLVPPVQPAQPVGLSAATTDTSAQAERPPTLRERFRGAIARARKGGEAPPREDDAGYPQGPTVPTA